MKNLLSAVLHLFYPHICDYCGIALTASEAVLCLRCQLHLPLTGFELYRENPVAKIFWGRADIRYAMAAYYFTESAPLQQLVHQFKYHHRKDVALYLGRQTGKLLLQTDWIYEITHLVPVPLHPRKQRIRGYNQAALLAAGIAEIINRPVAANALRRLKYTDSQTKKSRQQRKENVTNVFCAGNVSPLHNGHVLLIDDVITTGATILACSQVLLQEKIQVSICGLAYRGH